MHALILVALLLGAAPHTGPQGVLNVRGVDPLVSSGGFNPQISLLPCASALPGKEQYYVFDGTSWACREVTATFVELDPVFASTPAAGITSENITHWDAAYSWGDHAGAGYLTTETDPQVGTLTAGDLCTSDGTTIACTTDPLANFVSLSGGQTVAGTLNFDAGINTASGSPGNYIQNWFDSDFTQVGAFTNSGMTYSTELIVSGTGHGITFPDATKQTTAFTGETDPQVGALTADKWCSSNGTNISCTNDPPMVGAYAAGTVSWGDFPNTSSFTGPTPDPMDIANDKIFCAIFTWPAGGANFSVLMSDGRYVSGGWFMQVYGYGVNDLGMHFSGTSLKLGTMSTAAPNVACIGRDATTNYWAWRMNNESAATAPVTISTSDAYPLMVGSYDGAQYPWPGEIYAVLAISAPGTVAAIDALVEDGLDNYQFDNVELANTQLLCQGDDYVLTPTPQVNCTVGGVMTVGNVSDPPARIVSAPTYTIPARVAATDGFEYGDATRQATAVPSCTVAGQTPTWNNVTSKWECTSNMCTLDTVQTLTGMKTFQANSGSVPVSIQNINSSGYSGVWFKDAYGNLAGHMGYANAGAAHFADQFYFGSIASKTLNLTTADAIRMTLDTDGDVGIGVTNPTSKLQVAGNTALAASGSQFTAYNEDTKKLKFTTWYSNNSDQFGFGGMFHELWLGAINAFDVRRIGFYLNTPDHGDDGTVSTNADMYVKLTGVEIKNNLDVKGTTLTANRFAFGWDTGGAGALQSRNGGAWSGMEYNRAGTAIFATDSTGTGDRLSGLVFEDNNVPTGSFYTVLSDNPSSWGGSTLIDYSASKGVDAGLYIRSVPNDVNNIVFGIKNGNVKIGGWSLFTDVISYKLDVAGSTRIQSSNKLYFGGTGSGDADVNLYRSAADTLKTDDTFATAGNVTLTTDNAWVGMDAENSITWNNSTGYGALNFKGTTRINIDTNDNDPDATNPQSLIIGHNGTGANSTPLVTISESGVSTFAGSITVPSGSKLNLAPTETNTAIYRVAPNVIRSGASFDVVGNIKASTFVQTPSISFTSSRWEDLRVPLITTKTGATKVPGFEAFKNNGGLSTGTYAYHFDAGSTEEVFFSVQLPHGYKEGTALKPHVHYTPKTVNTGDVVFELECTSAAVDGTFGNTSIITVTDAVDGTALKHQLASFTDISGSGLGISSMLMCRFSRNGGDANDTYADDVAVLEVGFHYEIDTVGSATSSAK